MVTGLHGAWKFKAPARRIPGEEIGNALGATPIKGDSDDGNIVFLSKRWGIQDVDRYLGTIAHEIGHVMLGPGHPNEEGGVAPFMGTDRSDRLMTVPHDREDRLLVKAEWDKAEQWLKNRPEGDD
jgi:hypothetical protein